MFSLSYREFQNDTPLCVYYYLNAKILSMVINNVDADIVFNKMQYITYSTPKITFLYKGSLLKDLKSYFIVYCDDNDKIYNNAIK